MCLSLSWVMKQLEDSFLFTRTMGWQGRHLAISKTQSVVSHGKNNLKSCLWPNSLYHAASFANFKGILGCFVPLIILADLLGNTCLLVIGAFRSTLFVSVFQGSLLVMTLF